MKNLYHFSETCGRMGDLEGLFVAEPSEVEPLYGRTIWFNDVLGKHTEIDVEITTDNLKCITSAPVVVNLFADHLDGSVGHNPLDEFDPDEEEE